MNKGETIASINPTCDCATLTVFLSQLKLIGSPFFFSKSPCLKNSSTHLWAHSLYIFNGFVGLDISAACIIKETNSNFKL